MKGKVLLALKRNSPTILTCIGAVGVVSTAVLAVKATPKAMQLLEVATDEKGEALTKFEMVKVAGPSYIPSVATCLATLTCIFGANALNRKQQASLISAYAMLDGTYREYRRKIRAKLGEEMDKQIQAEVEKEKLRKEYTPYLPTLFPDDKHLYYDMRTGSYFETSVDLVETDDGLECFIVDLDPVPEPRENIDLYYEKGGL